MEQNYNSVTCSHTAINVACDFSLLKNKANFILFSLFTFLGLNNAFGQTITQTTPGTYNFTVPCGVYSITVEAWGAGGGGYGDSNNDNIIGRGGGGGAFVNGTITVNPGDIVSYTVGAGGNGGNGANGTTGGDTTILSITAGGGTGGQVGAGGVGGIATGGTITNTNGGSGNNVGAQPTGHNGGAGANGGAGGAGGGDGANGSVGNVIGGGGGASGDRSGGSENGGNGVRGEIRITYDTTTIPANPGNPTSNSPQCNPPGVTLTRVGTPPAGVTWYWQTTALGTSTANSGSTFIVTTSGTYYLRAQNNTSSCWSPASGSLAVVVNNTPTITTPPANSSIAVGANTSFTVVANNSPNATGYVWQVSTDGGGLWTTITNGGVYSNATTSTLNITGATIGMDGYLYHVSASNGCGTSSYSTNATLNVTLAYCTPSFTSSVEPISNVTFNTINNNSANTCGAGTSYENFTGISTSVFRGFTYNVSATGTTCGNFTNYIYAYFDWNKDGDFVDAGESYNLGSINNTTAGVLTQAITIPIGATLGSTRMRIIKNFNTAPTDPCRTGAGFGQAEDYTIIIVSPPVCTTPTAQPTALILTPAGTSIAGSFTAASPAPDSYLVVISTSATAPTAPANGTTYAIGSSLASGYIVVDNDTNTTFTAGGLNISTTYYFYIFSYNRLCSGGPLYYTTSPLLGNATTTGVSPVYCGGVNPSSSAVNGPVYINSIRSVGTINDVTNGSTGYSAGGYGNYTATTIATQIAGGGINIEMVMAGTYNTGPPTNCVNTSQFTRAWVDWNKDGDFDDSGELVFISGTEALPVATAIDNIFGFVIPSGTFPGNYRIRIRTKIYQCDTSGGSSGIINSCGFHNSGETEDYTITVVEDCPSKILTVTGGSACGPTNTVTLNATKTASATGFRWYANITGGAPLATTAAGTWTTPSISTTTTYYVTAYDSICETIHRTPVVATILTTTNITVTPSVPEVCGEGNVVQISAAGDVVTETLLLQTFDSGMAPFTVTTPTNISGGADTPWSVKTSVYVPAGTSVWKPALNSGAVGTIGNNFAFTTSDYNGSDIQTIMTSPIINASLYTTLNLTFDQMYGAFSGDTAIVQAFNGTVWTTIATYTATDIGTPSVFTKMAPINLNAYAGNANLQIRFIYTAQWDDGWAVDNIKVEGVRPLNTTFTWTGGTVNAFIDAGLTTPYVAQSVTTVYVVPSALQLASPSWSFTANATLGNGCPVSQLITINNKTKLWKGNVDNNWYNANNWEPTGVPDANTCVFIYDGAFDSNINIGGNYALAKTLTVRSAGLLEIQPNNNLTVTDGVTVDGGGTFTIENSGNLVQINNVVNSGNITYKRITNVRRQDYVYWSTPVASFASNAVSPGTNLGYQYSWIPTIGGNFGNWTLINETMVLGKGYCLRAPDAFSLSAAANYTASFVGVPNNGDITTSISRGTYTGVPYLGPASTTLVTQADDNWNFVGNPYPSAIDAKKFLTLNANITGFVNIWTHGTLPSNLAPDPFYNDYVYNYSQSDYIAYNLSGPSTQNGFNGLIGAGQGFFVSMLDSGASTQNLNFNNALRRDIPTGNTYNNGQFYKTSNTNGDSNAITNDLERHRIWFDLVKSNGNESVRAMLGFIENATNEKDRLFDAFTTEKLSFNIFSLIDDEIMIIQGRKLPFDTNDKVGIGVSIPQDGLYKIALSAVDGLFLDKNQNIYLEDKLLNVIYSLKEAPYTFIANKGIIKDRFVLRFAKEKDATIVELTNQLIVYDNKVLTVQSGKLKIKNVQVFDILGKQLIDENNVNNSAYEIKNLSRTNSLMIVKVTLEDNSEEVRKVIY